MNADTFKFEGSSNTCPVCRRAQVLPLGQIKSGLYICPYCHQRLVVSTSGHYVRDPFVWKPFISSGLLRRQSHPLARVLRDFGGPKPLSWITVVGSIVLFSLALATTERVKMRDEPLPNPWEKGIQVIWPHP